MKNTSLKQIAQKLGVACDLDISVMGYQIDSRKITPGELFFALKGERSDGHLFLSNVRAQGGVAAVVAKEYEGSDFGLMLLPVDDVLMALHCLARYAASQYKAKVVAITGSMGKTTTKDFAATLLEGKFRVGKTYLSYNSKLTFPITVLNMQGDEEVLILEMGMDEQDPISCLVEIAPPDIAVLTEVAFAHYGVSFPNILDIARAKFEIFQHPKTKCAIFYHGFLQYKELVDVIAMEKVSFSLEDRSADYFLSLDVVDERGVRAPQLDLPSYPPHVRHNLLAAIAIARALNMGWDEINRRLPFLQLPKMRFEQFEKEGVLFVNDAYNANPSSVKAALSAFPSSKAGGKRIAILGAMSNLGGCSKSLHEEVGLFALGYVDHLLTYGDEAAFICSAFSEGKKPAEHFLDIKALTSRLKELMLPGDSVLVKGSRFLELERIFELGCV